MAAERVSHTALAHGVNAAPGLEIIVPIRLDRLAAAGIAYVPYFPLGGFTPLQSGVLDDVAASLGATPLQVALAWLLQRSPNVLLIPGTSSVAHLRENVAAASLRLPPEAVAKLDAIGAPAAAH